MNRWRRFMEMVAARAEETGKKHVLDVVFSRFCEEDEECRKCTTMLFNYHYLKSEFIHGHGVLDKLIAGLEACLGAPADEIYPRLVEEAEQRVLETIAETGRTTFTRLTAVLKDKYTPSIVADAVKQLAGEGKIRLGVELRCPKCHAHIGDYRSLREAREELEKEGFLLCAEGHVIESIDEALAEIIISPAEEDGK